MRIPYLSHFQFYANRKSVTHEPAHLEGNGCIPQLLVELHQRILYAPLCHQSANPLRLRSLDHKFMDREQSPKKAAENSKTELRARARNTHASNSRMFSNSDCGASSHFPSIRRPRSLSMRAARCARRTHSCWLVLTSWRLCDM
jgi:hypothetical protein